LESVAEEQLVRVYSRLGHTSTYERAVLEQGKYEAGRLRNYVAKLARYPGKVEGAAEFLFRHTGERVFYVAPWLSRLSGVTMTVARLWSARNGYCAMPKMTEQQEQLVRGCSARWSPLRTLRERPPAAPPPVGSAWGPRVSEANAGAGPTGRGRAQCVEMMTLESTRTCVRSRCSDRATDVFSSAGGRYVLGSASVRIHGDCGRAMIEI
jgi:hypothetical protein